MKKGKKGMNKAGHKYVQYIHNVYKCVQYLRAFYKRKKLMKLLWSKGKCTVIKVFYLDACINICYLGKILDIVDIKQ